MVGRRRRRRRRPGGISNLTWMTTDYQTSYDLIAPLIPPPLPPTPLSLPSPSSFLPSIHPLSCHCLSFSLFPLLFPQYPSPFSFFSYFLCSFLRLSQCSPHLAFPSSLSLQPPPPSCTPSLHPSPLRPLCITFYHLPLTCPNSQHAHTHTS